MTTAVVSFIFTANIQPSQPHLPLAIVSHHKHHSSLALSIPSSSTITIVTTIGIYIVIAIVINSLSPPLQSPSSRDSPSLQLLSSPDIQKNKKPQHLQHCNYHRHCHCHHHNLHQHCNHECGTAANIVSYINTIFTVIPKKIIPL